MMLRLIPILLVTALAGCSDKVAAPVATDESNVAAKAVADVDAATAEARTGDPAVVPVK